MAVKVELQYEENFKGYLCNKFYNQRVISDCISRCKRVQTHEGNLAEHYLSDKGKQLLNRLYYSIDDANQGKQPNHSISSKGTKGYQSIYEGTKSLDSAVRRYFEFMRQQVGS